MAEKYKYGMVAEYRCRMMEGAVELLNGVKGQVWNSVGGAGVKW